MAKTSAPNALTPELAVRRAQHPAAIEPMLAIPGELPSAEDGWAFEPKWSGVRAVVSLSGGQIRATGRNRREITANFPELLAIADLIPDRDVVLDGEVVALDDEGVPRYALLQQRLNLASATTVVRQAKEFPATFLAFDVLALDGQSTLDASYDERRALLASLGLAGKEASVSEAYTDRSGDEVFRASIRQGIDGVVAKRRDSPYQPGERSPDWITVKAVRTQEVVVVGWITGQGRLADTFGSLMLAVPVDDKLQYAGKVGAGFDAPARAELLAQMKPLTLDEPAFDATGLNPRDLIGAHYIQPQLVGEVRFGDWTRDGRMRHPSWRGLRPDKTITDIHRD